MAPKKKVSAKQRTPRKRCSLNGCRKLRLDTTEFCRDHQNEVDPGEKVVKLDELDALRFGKADAEIRNAVQGQQLIDYKISKIQEEANAKIKALNMEKLQLISVVKNHQGNYKELVKGIADTYGIPDPSQMAIDPDNGTVRDLRKP